MSYVPYQDKVEQHRKMRQDVMSEEEIRQGERYLEYYRSAWQDKSQRGLFDKWEEMDLYWEGDVNLPESDADPGSNTNVVHPNVEGQVALLVEQNIAIQAYPVGPSDAPFANMARIILEWCKEKNKLKRKLDVHERRREKFGTGIFRVLYDPDAVSGPFGLPVIEPRNPAYVYIDPAITDVYRIQDARFVIEVASQSIAWAENNPRFDEERVKAIMPGHDPIEEEWLFGEDEGENDPVSRDTYLHMWVWTKKRGELHLCEMSGCGVILYDSAKDDDEPFYPNGKYPYFFTPCYYREGTIWGKGTAELLINSQNIIDDLDDQIRINARLTGNPSKVIDVASGIDIDKMTNEPALNIPSTDTNGIRYLEPPKMPDYIIRRRDQALTYETQRITRFSDQMTGQRQEGVDTATESLALQQAGSGGIDHKKIMLQETLSEVFEYCLDLIKEYYTEEMAFRITEQDNQFIWFNASKLKEVPALIPANDAYRRRYTTMNGETEAPRWMQSGSDTKEAMFDIEVEVGAGLPRNKAFVYQAIREAYRDRALSLQEYRKLLKEYVHLPIEDEPAAAQIPPEILQRIQQAMAARQSANLSPDVAGLSQGQNPAALGGGQGGF